MPVPTTLRDALKTVLATTFPDKQFFWADDPITLDEVLDEQGFLPVLVRQARTTAAATSEKDFLACIDSMESEYAALREEVRLPARPPDTGFAPMLLFLLDSVHLAESLTPDDGRIDLRRIDPPVTPKLEDFLQRQPTLEQDASSPMPE